MKDITETTDWRERFDRLPIFTKQIVGDDEIYLEKYVLVDKDFIQNTIHSEMKRMIEKIKKIEAVCGECNQSGMNPYGECKCSYEGCNHVRKKDLIKVIKEIIRDSN